MLRIAGLARLAGALVLSCAATAQADDFVATLSGAQEVPPVATAAQGSATITLNGNNTVTYSVVTTGLVALFAHIHTGIAGVNGPILITLAGGPTTWAGTSAALTPAQVTMLKTGGMYVNVHTAANPGGEIRGQIQTKVIFFNKANVTLGQASASLEGGTLTVDSLWDCMNDGVKISLPDVSSGFHVGMGAVQLSGAGRCLTLSATGSFNGVANSALGSAGFQNNGGVVQAVADFSAIGSTLVTVMVMDDGKFVGASTVSNGVVATVATVAGPVICDGVGKLPPDPPCIWIDFDDDVVVDPTGVGGAMIGDTLLMLAANATGAIDFLTEYEIRAAGVGSMTLTCESGFAGTVYGSACAGTGGIAPNMTVTGCPVVGNVISINVAHALPNSSGIVFVGLAQSAVPVLGCLFQVLPIALQINVPLDSNGAISIPAPLPPGVGGLQVMMQTWVIDPGGLHGASATNGVVASFEP